MRSQGTVVISIAVLVVCLLTAPLAAPGSQASAPASPPEPAGGESSIAAGWSSGWVPIASTHDIVLHHGLGGDPSEYAIQLWFQDTGPDNYGINSRAYGGLEANGNLFGAYWHSLDNSDVRVYRHAADTFADFVRVWIWVPEPLPDWCSTWTPIAPGETRSFTHNLGGNVDNYVVGLWFLSSDHDVGVNHFAYGGMEASGDLLGAWWHNLTATDLQVHRAPDDVHADQVRVCVTVAEPPDYDSGWVTVAAGRTLTLDHNLGGDVNRYVVRVHFLDDSPLGIGIHHENYGGNAVGDTFLGTNWQHLTDSQIELFRRGDDVHTDQVRVRIWMRRTRLFLPLVVRND